jgi:salicylate hydroxylase
MGNSCSKVFPFIRQGVDEKPADATPAKSEKADSTNMPAMRHAEGAEGQPLEVAIVGGGITGLALALGLQKRGVKFTVYERSPAFQEIGAGIALSPNAERALIALNPVAQTAFKRIANPNGEDYFQWIDGHGTDELIYRLFVGKDMFNGCRRSDLSEEMGKEVDRDRVQFNKHVDTVVEDEDGRMLVKFKDGTEVKADIGRNCNREAMLLWKYKLLTASQQSPAAMVSALAFDGLF